MKLSLERKILAGFAGALLVLLLVASAAWWNVARFRSTHYWVDHTREVLNHLQRIQSSILGMQGSSRGFVLTGSEDVLEPFHAGSADLAHSLGELRRLIADNPRQRERLAALEPIARQAEESMQARIAARRSRGLEAARETETYLEGQRLVETFRDAVEVMERDERQLLDNRLGRAAKVGRWTVFTIVAMTALAIGLVILAARQIRRDLVRRQKTEEALQVSLRRAQDLYDRAPCGYHSLDATGTVIAINETALGWLGLPRAEVVGQMKFVDILTEESAAEFRERYPAFMRSGTVTNVEYTWRRSDGSTFPVLLNATAIYDGNGRYTASRATVFDLTERKRAEAERDRFFTLSRDLLCIAGDDGYFKRINPSWQETLGFTETELKGSPFLEFVHVDDRERTLREARRLTAGEESIAFENRFRCKDGSHRWLRWNARAVLGEGLIFASAHDVTNERTTAENIRRLNSELAEHARELESANRELESFSYSVSHDLRAPLRHIDGFASLLTKRVGETLDAEAKRYVAVISRSAKQMGALIDDLLAFSRISRVPLRLEHVNQNQLVAEVIANGRYDANFPGITWEIAPLPTARADAALLRQVWSNLVDNAVKYSSKAPTPRVAIGGHASNGECIFFVRDNGVGFDMAYVEKLFGVFQRLHSPAEFEGTGIGLANVRRIVTRHGGRTWAEGRVDHGAAFYFSLPADASSSG